MIELLSNPAAWASFLTLTVLEIVLGVDNVIFISIAADRLPPHQRRRARFIGLTGALILRVILLLSITFIMGLSEPVVSIFGLDLSWRSWQSVRSRCAGLACFAWPIVMRLSGKGQAEPLGSGKSLRSPLWWAGFLLTIAAIFLQRIASQQAG